MVMFVLSQNISNSMTGHIQDLESSKEVHGIVLKDDILLQ